MKMKINTDKLEIEIEGTEKEILNVLSKFLPTGYNLVFVPKEDTPQENKVILLDNTHTAQNDEVLKSVMI